MTTKKHSHIHNDLCFSRDLQTLTKGNHSPASTIQSQSPRYYQSTSNFAPRQNKQKSQLCKRFMSNGYCPYEGKCKFAHGSHQLRKNSQLNSKYKTKECDIFINEGYCIYGDRCNFIHNKLFEREIQPQIDLQFLALKSKPASRLLKLLQQ